MVDWSNRATAWLWKDIILHFVRSNKWSVYKLKRVQRCSLLVWFRLQCVARALICTSLSADLFCSSQKIPGSVIEQDSSFCIRLSPLEFYREHDVMVANTNFLHVDEVHHNAAGWSRRSRHCNSIYRRWNMIIRGRSRWTNFPIRSEWSVPKDVRRIPSGCSQCNW